MNKTNKLGIKTINYEQKISINTINYEYQTIHYELEMFPLRTFVRYNSQISLGVFGFWAHQLYSNIMFPCGIFRVTFPGFWVSY